MASACRASGGRVAAAALPHVPEPAAADLASDGRAVPAEPGGDPPDRAAGPHQAGEGAPLVEVELAVGAFAVRVSHARASREAGESRSAIESTYCRCRAPRTPASRASGQGSGGGRYARQEETHGMDEGVLAAVRRFPERRRAIEALEAGRRDER
jgi:hypothetical protein